MKFRDLYPHYLSGCLVSLLIGCGGGGGGGDSNPLAAAPVSSNQSPTLTLDLRAQHPENSVKIGTLRIDDPDGDEITLEISGEDAGSIVFQQPELLVFASAPDFENPLDQNEDNIYVFDLIVSDGELSVSESLQIDVADILEQKFDQALIGTSTLE
jgi:hypothetical protein